MLIDSKTCFHWLMILRGTKKEEAAASYIFTIDTLVPSVTGRVTIWAITDIPRLSSRTFEQASS